MKRYRCYLVLIIFILCFFPNVSYPFQSGDKNSKTIQKTTSKISSAYFNINNISTIIYNDGTADNYNSNAAFEYPKGSGKTAFFASGLVCGTKVNGKVRVGGSTYRSSLTPGRILEDGSAENPDATNVRVYRVRKDFLNADLQMESDDEKKTVREIYDQYKKDWEEWPVAYGAPFEDVNGNRLYEPNIDYPGIPGADQTLWFVANDLDTAKSENFLGSFPLGIEMQITIWGYDSTPPLGNALFKKYLIINKSKNKFEDMYLGIWSDPDIGNATDDYTGSDTLLNLGYTYNSSDLDEIYDGRIPAAGICLLQGPVVDGNENDYAYFIGRLLAGKKNLGATSFIEQSLFFSPDPNLSVWNYYNMLEGLNPFTGYPIVDPSTGKTTKFMMSGNPILKRGWYDGLNSAPGDRRFYLSSGPFNMTPGDTQEVVIVQLVSGLGDVAAGIYNLKTYAYMTARDYPNIFPDLISHGKALPEYFFLSNNYPNPFNASTEIIYEIPIDADVRLEVFNILGKKIKELVNGFHKAGRYKTFFDADNLASGVYIYSFRAGPYMKNRKMILLK